MGSTFFESTQSLPNRLYHWLKNLLSLFLMLAHADLKLNKLYLQLIVHGIICCSGQFPFTNFLSINGPSRSQTSGGKRDESCLVPRPHYSTGPKRFGSRDPGENASSPPPCSPRIRHRKVLTERDWENTVQGLGKDETYRVLKWWRHKNEISEIMRFVRIFWKNNVQEAYLPKMSISGQIVSEIIAQLCLENSIQTLLNFFWVDPRHFQS